MIEIIREEEISDTTEKYGLPKEIKQIGKPDIGDRIYIENQVYQFLHPYDSFEEKRAYVLLGRFENYTGKQCVFVEAVILLQEICFDGDLPIWNDQTWAYIYKQLKSEYDSMVIVGWAMDIKGQLPNMTARLDVLHQNNFGGAHQILYLMDSLEHEEAFYGNRNGHLYRREGFYVYYDKKISAQHTEEMQGEQETEISEKSEWDIRSLHEEEADWGAVGETDTLHRGNYRRQMEHMEERQLVPSYASTILLAVVVCALGITAYFNNEKMNAMQETLAQMNQTRMSVGESWAENEEKQQTEDAVAKQSETEVTEQADDVMQMQQTAEEKSMPNVAVETVAGNVEKQTGTQESEKQQEKEQQAEEQQMQEQSSQGQEAEIQQTQSSKGEQEEKPLSESEAPAGQQTAEAAEIVSKESEIQSFLKQGYYIVQRGDSLVGICKKIYQTTAMMDKLCEVNGIEDENAIYAGQELILPN